MNNTHTYTPTLACLNACRYLQPRHQTPINSMYTTGSIYGSEMRRDSEFSAPIGTSAGHTMSCSGCGRPITDRYLLNVAGLSWHEKCLKCDECGRNLSSESTCFFKSAKVLCKMDYERLFMVRCARCGMPVRPPDMIHRTGSDVYHLSCFTCSLCGKQFLTGDEYIRQDSQIMCRADFEACMHGSYAEAFSMVPYGQGAHRKAMKRPRTILTGLQRKTFKASFEISAKPCRKVREALAKETGLSVRVVQVWFQNQRAKMKKLHRKIDGKKHAGQEASESEDKVKPKHKAKEAKLRFKDYASSSVSDFESISETQSSCNMLDSPRSDTTSVADQESHQSESGKSKEDVEKRQRLTSSPPQATVNKANPIDRLYLMHSSYFSY